MAQMIADKPIIATTAAKSVQYVERTVRNLVHSARMMSGAIRPVGFGSAVTKVPGIWVTTISGHLRRRWDREGLPGAVLDAVVGQLHVHLFERDFLG